LCAAHVETERRFMELANTQQNLNICGQQFLSDANLPEKHLYTHTPKGFSRAPVNPGQIRDVNVSMDGRSLHGPDYQDLPALLKTFAQSYTPDQFHGDEPLIAMAASHHRLTWLHPFRDGNGSSNWGRVLRPCLD